MAYNADKHDMMLSEDFCKISSMNYNITKAMTCFRWDISKVGYGITDENSVIELFTKIKIQTIGRNVVVLLC